MQNLNSLPVNFNDVIFSLKLKLRIPPMVLIQFNKRLDLLLQNPSLLLPDFFSLPKILHMLILHPSHLLIHLKLINL